MLTILLLNSIYSHGLNTNGINTNGINTNRLNTNGLNTNGLNIHESIFQDNLNGDIYDISNRNTNFKKISNYIFK